MNEREVIKRIMQKVTVYDTSVELAEKIADNEGIDIKEAIDDALYHYWNNVICGSEE